MGSRGVLLSSGVGVLLTCALTAWLDARMVDVRGPDRALLYHFTHVDNLSSIFRSGRLLADRTARAGGLATEVGAADIKANRRARAVPNGLEVVSDYVPFYFATRSPMMFRIACEHRDGVAGRYPGGDDPLVYLVTSVDEVIKSGRRWLATDGNAAAAITTFTSDVDALHGLVDWTLMEADDWRNTPEDRDRRRRRGAEFLVHDHLPTSALLGCAVRTQTRNAQVRAALAATRQADLYVDVRPTW